MIPAPEALARLIDGNRRFVGNVVNLDARLGTSQRKSLVNSQHPFAVILGCSDSRVPAELVFGQGLGDLFVIRVAGNIVAPSQVGSVEFAADQFATRLVVVLGHTHCGAILATVRELTDHADNPSPNLRSIVDRIRPAVDSLIEDGLSPGAETFVAEAVRANVRASVDRLRHGSAILEDLIANHGLMVVGAEYSLETGRVDFFDRDPRAASLPALPTPKGVEI